MRRTRAAVHHFFPPFGLWGKTTSAVHLASVFLGFVFEDELESGPGDGSPLMRSTMIEVRPEFSEGLTVCPPKVKYNNAEMNGGKLKNTTDA